MRSAKCEKKAWTGRQNNRLTKRGNGGERTTPMLSRIREIVARLQAFWRAAPLDRDLDTEMASHLQFAIEENIERGMSPQEAERQARISFGGPQQSKEHHRESRSLPLLD